MRRSVYPTLLAFGLACAAIGCLKDLEDLCQTDGDCPVGQRCQALDGVKYCVGDSTGPGGTGGTGGTGGGGGGEEFEAVVDLELLPDSDLAAYLTTAKREAEAITLRYSTGGKDRQVDLPLSEPSNLPLAPMEIRLPLASEVESLKLRVEARTQRRDEVLATFAFGEVTEEFSANDRTSVTVNLSLDSAFDWDGDGDADVTDCEPDDPEVHNDAYDLCDGKRQACGQDFCFIRLDDGQTVGDLSCSTAERKCAAVLTTGDQGIVRIYEPSFPSEPVDVEGITKAMGIAWNSSGGKSHLIMAEPWLLSFSDPSGNLLPGQLGMSVEISGAVKASVQGNIAIVSGAGALLFVAFEPGAAAEHSKKVTCDTTGSACTTVVLDTTFGGDGKVPVDSHVTRADVYRPVSVGDIGVHLQFSGFERLGFVRLTNTRMIKPDESGLMTSLVAGRPPRFISSFGNDGRLFVSLQGEPAEEEALWLQKGLGLDSQGDPVPVTLPPSSCPSALDSQRSDSALLMADDCTGSLWELPLDEEGKPMGEGFVRHPLGERCAEPFVLASLPAADEEGAVTFVGCKGENHILVHGRM